MQDNKVDAALQAIRDVIAAEVKAAYNRGKADAKAEIFSILSADSTDHEGKSDHHDAPTPIICDAEEEDRPEDGALDATRKRAPRGLPRALAERALAMHKDEGCTPADILLAAESDYEKMIKLTSIRSELRKGRKEGRYEERGGIWFLTDGVSIEDLLK